ncbi:MAG TPA: hypothetical protein VEX70_13235 [Pyrinomonadaceae bacterium]|jgi:hypothetical protein|nr:hypothetical protein [Pyrinomonadaceae bacterium]
MQKEMRLSQAEVEIDDPAIAINIRQQFPYVRSAKDLFECTRSMWRLNPRRAERAKYLFAVYDGIIREVYEIHQCIPATDETKEYWRKREREQGRNVPAASHEGRAEFLGQVASDKVRAKYLGRSIPVRLTQNPVRYFNC